MAPIGLNRKTAHYTGYLFSETKIYGSTGLFLLPELAENGTLVIEDKR